MAHLHAHTGEQEQVPVGRAHHLPRDPVEVLDDGFHPREDRRVEAPRRLDVGRDLLLVTSLLGRHDPLAEVTEIGEPFRQERVTHRAFPGRPCSGASGSSPAARAAGG